MCWFSALIFCFWYITTSQFQKKTTSLISYCLPSPCSVHPHQCQQNPSLQYRSLPECQKSAIVNEFLTPSPWRLTCCPTTDPPLTSPFSAECNKKAFSHFSSKQSTYHITISWTDSHLAGHSMETTILPVANCLPPCIEILLPSSSTSPLISAQLLAVWFVLSSSTASGAAQHFQFFNGGEGKRKCSHFPTSSTR